MAYKKILRICAYSVAGLLLIVIAGILTLWFNLDLVMNEANLEKYKSRFLPQDSTLTWDDLNIDIESSSWAKRHLTVDSKGLCFKWTSDMSVSACFDEIRLSLGVRLLPRPQLLVLREILVIDREIRIKLTEKKDTSSPPAAYDELYHQAFDYWIMAEELVNDYEFERIRLETDNFSLQSGDKTFEISLQSNFQSPQAELPFIFEVASQDGKMNLSGKVGIEIEAKGGTLSQAALNARLNLTDKIFSTDVNLSKKLYSTQAHLDVKTDIRKTTHPLLVLHITSLLTDENVHLQIESGNIYLPEPLTLLELQNCKGTIRVSTELQSESSCKPLIKWNWKPQLAKRIEEICECKLPRYLELSVVARGALQFFINPEFEDRFEVDVQVPDYNFKFLTMDIDGVVELFRTDDGQLAFDPDVKAKLSIKRFETLVTMLEGSPFAVPAPFHVLQGPADLDITTNSNLETDTHFGARLQLDSKLKSATQEASVRADLNAKVAKNFKPPYEVEGDIIIRSIVLELPPFYPVSGVPGVFKSAKIKEDLTPPGQQQDKPPSIRYDLRVFTQNPNAIRLRWNLVDPFIPVSVDVALKGQQALGRIDLDQFTLETFGRQTVIEDLKLTLPKLKNDTPAVEAHLRAEQGGYTIFIEVIGKIDDVQIYLRSNPPLPRNDIISVLIYGRTFDNLAGTERDNVGNTGAAIADRAIGLFGIWLFASTPIQSVSYNPATQSYSAQVKVSDSTVLSVGTDWESVQNLELRRHLKGNWMVVTSYEPGEGDSGKGSLVLQWQKFY